MEKALYPVSLHNPDYLGEVFKKVSPDIQAVVRESLRAVRCLPVEVRMQILGFLFRYEDEEESNLISEFKEFTIEDYKIRDGQEKERLKTLLIER